MYYNIVNITTTRDALLIDSVQGSITLMHTCSVLKQAYEGQTLQMQELRVQSLH